MEPEIKRARVNSPAEIVPEVDVEAEEVEVDVRKLVKQLEKSVNNNLKLRAKHADQPENFVDSEVDLDECILNLSTLAASPQLFPELIRLGTVNTVIGLLAHENNDICADTVNLLNDLFSQGEEAEEEGFVMQLAEAFLKSNGPAALSSCLSRFGEDEDGTRSVYNALSVIENLLEMKPDISQGILQQPKLRQFLVNGVKKDRPHSSIKQYCAELLAMLAQNDDGCKKLILSDGGIDTILECIGDMRKRDPESEDERETILDLFNILCSAMFIDEAKTLLLKAEGIQLMLILLKRRKWLRSQCLKLIDFSINGRKDGCKIFIDAGGLGVVFSFLMKVKGKERTTVEESLLSIIVELLRRTDGPDFERAVWKLEENSYEKLWRVTAILAQAAVDLQPYGDLEYSDRLDNGLYRAQLAAKCIALVCTKETNKPIASEMLKEVSLELNDVRTNLEELISNIDDDDEEAKSEKEFAAKLIEAVR